MCYIKKLVLFSFVFTTLLFQSCNKRAHVENTSPNVLFIAVDDMADWAGYLGHPDAITPNIDRLAKQGIAFTATQCTSPICGPSRAAVMTGMRPETTNVYSNVGNYSDYMPEAISIPEYFKQNGYYVMGAGKLIHPYNNVIPKAYHEFGPGVGIVGTPFTDEELMSNNMDPTITIERLNATLPMNVVSNMDRPGNRWSTFDWGPLDVTDDQMPDGKIANWGVKALHKAFDKPFFVGVGFYKPHQPLFAPRKYFDMYDIDKISLPPTTEGDLNDIDETSKMYALGTSTGGKHNTVTKYNQWRKGVLSYLATITFVDAQIGKVLDQLDKSPYADNTLIVFWSDHGWHLGEKEHWGKQTVWKNSTRVPMIIVPPKNSKIQKNQKRNNPVNLLDIYPTLVEMCNLSKHKKLEGNNLYPLVVKQDAKIENVSITTMGRGTNSIRTKKWRYIQYFDGSEELYDVVKDPNEWVNLSKNEKYNKINKKLNSYVVEDKRIKRYARMGNWKIVEEEDGNILLFDLRTPPRLTETTDVSSNQSDLVDKIRKNLKHIQKTKNDLLLKKKQCKL